MIDRQSPYDRVLDLVEVLELVDQNFVPACAHLRCNRINAKQLRRFENEGIEVGDVSPKGQLLISLKTFAVTPLERGAAKTVAGERIQQVLLLPGRNAQPPQHRFLVVLIGNPGCRPTSSPNSRSSSAQNE